MTGKKSAKADQAQAYHEMLASVETIVGEVQQGDLDLDQMVEKIEQGYGLIKTMRGRLDQTKERIDALREDFEAEQQES